MTTPQSRTFVNGVLTAEEVQRANPDSLSGTTPPCLDRSRFAGGGGQISQGNLGTRATMAATSSARYGTVYYMMDAGNGNRGGVAASPRPPCSPSATTIVRRGPGLGETEFTFTSEATDIGAQRPTPKS
jgi:hypothetical protein